MRTSDFLLPFLVSAGIHVGLLTAGLSSHGAQPMPPDTPACVVLNLLPPAATEASGEIEALASSPEQAPRALPRRVQPEPSVPPTETVRRPEPIAPPLPLPPVDVDETPAEAEPEADDATPVDLREPAALGGYLPGIGPSGAGTGRASVPVGPLASGGPGPGPHRMTRAAPVPPRRRVIPPPPVPSNSVEPALAPAEPDPDDTDRPGDMAPDEPNGDTESGGAAVAAQILGVSKPGYPDLSRRRSEEGRVVLAVEIRADGSRGDIRIVQSSGHPRLDQAGVQALKNAKFIPATRGGKPVASTKQVAFTFRLVDAGS